MRVLFSTTALSVVLMLLSFPLRGQSPSYRFIVKENSLDREDKIILDDGITAIFKIYQEGFGVYLEEEFEIKIRVFNEYYEYKLHQFGSSHASSNAAFYSFRYNEAVVWKRKNNAQLYSDIFHEVNHLIMRNMKTTESSDFRYRPFWINEGLSEYFETLHLRNGSAWVTPQVKKHQRCKEWVKSGDMGAIGDFLQLSYKELKKTDTKENRFYARTMAWALVYFMMSRPEGVEITGKVLRFLEQNQQEQQASITAIEQFYPGGTKGFEADWLTWLNQKPGLHLLKDGRTEVVPGTKTALLNNTIQP